MSADPFRLPPDRSTTVERRGLIALAILVCVTILAIAAWRSRAAGDESAPEAVMTEVNEATDTAAEEAAEEEAPARTPAKKPSRKKSYSPPPPRESPLNRPL